MIFEFLKGCLSASKVEPHQAGPPRTKNVVDMAFALAAQEQPAVSKAVKLFDAYIKYSKLQEELAAPSEAARHVKTEGAQLSCQRDAAPGWADDQRIPMRWQERVLEVAYAAETMSWRDGLSVLGKVATHAPRFLLELLPCAVVASGLVCGGTGAIEGAADGMIVGVSAIGAFAPYVSAAAPAPVAFGAQLVAIAGAGAVAGGISGFSRGALSALNLASEICGCMAGAAVQVLFGGGGSHKTFAGAAAARAARARRHLGGTAVRGRAVNGAGMRGKSATPLVLRAAAHAAGGVVVWAWKRRARFAVAA